MFGRSEFAIVVDGKIQVIHDEEYGRPYFSEMISEVWSLKQQLGHVTNIYVDAANPVVWQSLKRELDEPFDQQYIKEKIECAKKYNFHVEDQLVVPVPLPNEGAKIFNIQSGYWTKRTNGTSRLIEINFHKLVSSTVYNEYRV